MAFQTTMFESIHLHTFSWTIDNFKFSKRPNQFKGPPFSPIPRCSEKFWFEMFTFDLGADCCCSLLSLICSNAQDLQYNVAGCVKLLNANDKILQNTAFPTSQVGKNTKIATFFLLLHGKKLCGTLRLSGDKLILKGNLVFTSYSITSKVCPAPATKSVIGDGGDLSNDLKTMYESGFSSDVTFSVGGKNLRAHKTILIGRSSVFAEMFEHDMLEKNTNRVIIEDVNFEAFNSFLLFLYTGAVEHWEWDTVLALYSVAAKYEVKSLLKVCSGILTSKMAVDNVCSVLFLSELHGDRELKETVKAFIRENLVQVVGTIQWAEIIVCNPQLANEVLLAPLHPFTLPSVKNVKNLEWLKKHLSYK